MGTRNDGRLNNCWPFNLTVQHAIVFSLPCLWRVDHSRADCHAWPRWLVLA